MKAKNGILQRLMKNPQIFILILLVIVVSITTPKFATLQNIINVLKSISIISIISCGLTFVVISGALDLSVGSLFSLLGVVMVTLQQKSIVAALIITIACALVLGLFNGVIISYFRLNSIIVTLGSLSVFAGIALIYTNGSLVMAAPDSALSFFTKTSLFGIPLSVFIFIGIAVIYEIIIKKTSFGRKIVYCGINETAAEIAGIRVGIVRSITFMISGFSVAVSAILLSSRMMSASPVSGVGFEFDAITAVVIGGVSLQGGKGSIYNTLIGVFLLAIIINVQTLYNVPFAFQNITKGLLIIIAVTLDVRVRSRIEK